MRPVFLRQDVLSIAIIFLVGFGSFGLGKLSERRVPQEPVVIDYSNVFTESVLGEVALESSEETVEPNVAHGFVGSKNGTKYHYPWCPGALQIKEKNKVWFGTKEAAEDAGYTPAANCKGL